MKRFSAKSSSAESRPFSTNSQVYRRLAIFLPIFLITVFICTARAQNPQPQQTPITTIQQPQNPHQWGAVTLFNGLPSDNVRAIAQTPDGFLWFGTQNGLARFDGRRVQNFTPADLPSANILMLKIDDGGALWIGTDAGAGRFANERFTSIPETLGKPIASMLDGENGAFVGADTIYRFSLKPDNSLDVSSFTLNAADFTGAARTANGKLVFSSRGRGILIEENGEIMEIASRPRAFFVNTIYRTKAGDLWFGAQAGENASGLFLANDLARPENVGENTGTVTAVAEDAAGDLWIGTEKNGLFRLRAGRRMLERFTFENTAGGLRSNSIYALYIDRENVVWIGTNRGLCRFDSASLFNETLSESGNANFVRRIFRARSGRIYAGTNRGLFAAAENGWTAAEKFAVRTVYDIHETSGEKLLIATAGGLFDADGKPILPGDVRAVVNFRGETYAAVFGRGVVRVADQIQVSGADETNPTALFADEKNLWIGTAQNGVFRFDGQTPHTEKSLEILRGAAVRRIFKEREGVFWFSGEAGLFRFENGAAEKIIDGQDVRDVAVSGTGDVWAATLRGGLFHLKFDEHLGWLVSDINVEQGLPSEQIFSILPLENRLLIGTNRGVVNYEPSRIAPAIVVTRLLGQRLFSGKELDEAIRLEYPQNSLLLEVAGLSSRTFPEQFQYGFLLKNESGEIIDQKLSNDGQFSMTNLKAGKYKIETQAYNKDLLASAPLVLEFTVDRAPFPLTAAALGVLLAIALIGLIWAISERRRIRHKNRELARARFDLANEAERERKRIARDLHDQTLADLRALMLKSDEIPAQGADFRREIEAVSTEIRRICEDLSPSVLENVGLTPALEFLLTQTIAKHRFSAPDDAEERINLTPNVQMQIYRIAQEVLTNIKHHGDAQFVEMKIEISPENDFLLDIADDGTFFDPQQISSKGRGIANIRSRIALIKAAAVWHAQPARGTVFRLTLKMDETPEN